MRRTELYKRGTEVLLASGIESAKTDAFLLLQHVSGVDRARFYAHPEEESGADEIAGYQDLIRKRASRIPLQHLLGEWDFMGLSFYAGPEALIPRPETEILAGEALARLREDSVFLDLCTGSGCIAVSIMALSGKAGIRGIASDISADALTLAGKNAKRHGVSPSALRFV